MAAIRKQVPQKQLHMQHLYKLWKQILDLLQAKVYMTQQYKATMVMSNCQV